ncbi:MAG: type III pantothenate kinase [Bacteroidaceae bacterium]|nr:type III pantothenate kinase [Bacteroidaceae bacterium]
MNLVIDIGNSYCKAALFEERTMKEFHKGSNRFIEILDKWSKNYNIKKAIVSSVIEIPATIVGQLEKLSCQYIQFNAQTKLPIKILYRTPHTLGVDRIAAVVGAQGEAPERDILVIDAGSAITYDFIDTQGNYHGGNIAPGINMRLTALHEHTGKLPLVLPEGDTPAMGYDTETAIRSGVINGIKHEIEGYISQISKKYPSLLVFLTGGDEKILINSIKSRIFADEFLVLKGLNRILTNHGTV